MISYKSIELPTYVRQLHDKNSYMINQDKNAC